MKYIMNSRSRTMWRSFVTTCSLLVLVMVGLGQETSAAVLFPVHDRSIAAPTHVDDVWYADDQIAAQIASRQTVLSLSTPSTDLVQVLEIPHQELMVVGWPSLFEVDQSAHKFTFNLVLQSPSAYGPIQLPVHTVDLASSSPVVWVVSPPSTVFLFVPALIGLLGVLLREQHPKTSSGSETESMAEPPPAGSAPSLLILSADAAFSNVIQAQVTQAGYPARIAVDVNDTLTISEHALPTLLLVDRRVPDWDMLRTSPLLKRVPLITLAPVGNLCTEDQWVSDLERGADSIYDCRDGSRLFLAKLRAALRRTGYAVTHRAVYQVGALHLDADHHEVTIAGQQLPLSAKPFAILKTLMEAPSKVFSRSELVDRVWGPQFAIGEHTLDVHVHALRRQLDRAPQRLCRLITIKGVGFKLKADDSVAFSSASTIVGSTRSMVDNRDEEAVTPAAFTPRYAEINPTCQPPSLPHVPVLQRVARRPRSRMRRRPTVVGHSVHAAMAG